MLTVTFVGLLLATLWPHPHLVLLLAVAIAATPLAIAATALITASALGKMVGVAKTQYDCDDEKTIVQRRYIAKSFNAASAPVSTTASGSDAATQSYDTVVVGGGIGGMAAASILAQAGQRVLVLEQHDRLGGATHCFPFTKDGKTCEFDSGYHYTCYEFCDPTTRTGAILNYACGGFCQFSDLGDPYDRLLFPGQPVLGSTEYTFIRDLDKLADHLSDTLSSHPDTNALIKRRLRTFYSMCRKAPSGVTLLFALTAFLPNWMGNLFRGTAVAGVVKYGTLTTAYVVKAVLGFGYSEEEVLARKALPDGSKPLVDGDPAGIESACRGHTSDPDAVGTLLRLCAVCVHPMGDYGVPPKDSSFLAHAFVVMYYARGSSYPKSSAQNMSSGMARSVLDHGGDAVCNAQVTEIVLDDAGDACGVRVKKSTSAEGSETVTISAKNVVNAAGTFNLHRKFLPQDHSAVLKFNALQEKDNSFTPSMSHAYVFVALDVPISALEKTNLWCFQPSGDDANDIDGAFDRYFEDPATERPPAVYITFPCAKEDPDAENSWTKRNPGVSNAIIFCDADYKWFEEWQNDRLHHRSAEYEEFKNRLTQSMLATFFEKRPDLKGKVLWTETGTPLTSEYYLGAYRGADYGSRVDTDYFSTSGCEYLMRSRLSNGIGNLFQAGQDAMTPSISGAMHGGVMCAWDILGPKTAWGSVCCVMQGQYREHRVRGLGVLSAVYSSISSWC